MKTLSLLALGGLLALAVVAAASDVKKEDVPKLLKELKSGVPKTRATAAEDLGHLGAIRAEDTKPAVPLLLEMARKDSDAKVREAAAKALGRMGADPKEAVPVLTEALKKDKVMAVRVAAARALGQLGPDAKDAVPTLREVQQAAQKDKDKRLAQAAGDALRNIRAR